MRDPRRARTEENETMAFSALGGDVQTVPGAVATRAESERVAFIRRTYAHLGGAILAFAGLEALLINSELGMRLTQSLLASGAWIAVLLGFMVVGWIANRWAMSGGSQGKQYLGLGLYVLAETIIFCPMLFIAQHYVPEGGAIIGQAAVATLLLFGGLTATVLITKKDLSFMGKTLTIAGWSAVALVFGGLLFGFNLGLWFSVAMIALASGYVLYYTSNVVHHYRTDQHVAAALALFAAIALLFWYILRLMIQLSSSD